MKIISCAALSLALAALGCQANESRDLGSPSVAASPTIVGDQVIPMADAGVRDAGAPLPTPSRDAGPGPGAGSGSGINAPKTPAPPPPPGTGSGSGTPPGTPPVR